jgi:pimeloyl-ACP methyl ester carboxylesterase
MRWLAVILLTSCVRHVPAPAADGLALRVREQLALARALEPGVMSDAARFHFLFVGGFLNETIPGYFGDNVPVVTDELGATASTCFPPSGGSLERDADLLHDEVRRQAEERQRPIVLIGHSKGGAAAVLVVLRDPELVRSGRVEHVVSIQGALRGSPLADGLVRSLPMPVLHEAFKGISSLTRQQAQSAFANLAPPAELADWYRRRVHFVRSFETTGQVSTELGVTHAFISRHGSGRNDGLVLEEDQLLPGVGHDLGVLRGDHAAFTIASPLSNGTTASRKAFTRALLWTLFVDERGE